MLDHELCWIFTAKMVRGKKMIFYWCKSFDRYLLRVSSPLFTSTKCCCFDIILWDFFFIHFMFSANQILCNECTDIIDLTTWKHHGKQLYPAICTQMSPQWGKCITIVEAIRPIICVLLCCSAVWQNLMFLHINRDTFPSISDTNY